MQLLLLCILRVTLPLRLSCNCPSSVPLSVASYCTVQLKLKWLCACVFASRCVRAGLAVGQDARMDAHAPHLSAAAVDQPPSVSVWEQPAVSSHGRTNRLSQIPAEGGADFGLILLLVRLWSPGALKNSAHGAIFLCLHVGKEQSAKDYAGKTWIKHILGRCRRCVNLVIFVNTKSMGTLWSPC